MKLLAFSVFDAAAGIYNPPIFAATKGLALRGFIEAVNDSNSSLSKHLADYTLFQIGEYDDNTGELTSTTPLSCGNALEYVDKG